jgi:hypothetical protein
MVMLRLLLNFGTDLLEEIERTVDKRTPIFITPCIDRLLGRENSFRNVLLKILIDDLFWKDRTS